MQNSRSLLCWLLYLILFKTSTLLLLKPAGAGAVLVSYANGKIDALDSRRQGLRRWTWRLSLRKRLSICPPTWGIGTTSTLTTGDKWPILFSPRSTPPGNAFPLSGKSDFLLPVFYHLECLPLSSEAIAAAYLEIPALHYLAPLKYFDIYAVAVDGIQISSLLLTAIVAISSTMAAQKVWAARKIWINYFSKVLDNVE